MWHSAGSMTIEEHSFESCNFLDLKDIRLYEYIAGLNKDISVWNYGH